MSDFFGDIAWRMLSGFGKAIKFGIDTGLEINRASKGKLWEEKRRELKTFLCTLTEDEFKEFFYSLSEEELDMLSNFLTEKDSEEIIEILKRLG